MLVKLVVGGIVIGTRRSRGNATFDSKD
jgi:hypothetical protein